MKTLITLFIISFTFFTSLKSYTQITDTMNKKCDIIVYIDQLTFTLNDITYKMFKNDEKIKKLQGAVTIVGSDELVVKFYSEDDFPDSIKYAKELIKMNVSGIVEKRGGLDLDSLVLFYSESKYTFSYSPKIKGTAFSCTPELLVGAAINGKLFALQYNSELNFSKYYFNNYLQMIQWINNCVMDFLSKYEKN